MQRGSSSASFGSLVYSNRVSGGKKRKKRKKERGGRGGGKKHGTHAYPVRNRRIDRGRKGEGGGDCLSGINRDGNGAGDGGPRLWSL